MTRKKISSFQALIRRILASLIPYAPLRKKMRSKWLRNYMKEADTVEQVPCPSSENLRILHSTSFENEINLLHTLFATSSYSGKKVLLISHEASLTGAPMALFHMAIQLKQMGHYPVFFSLIEGKMRAQLEKEKIPFLVDEHTHSYTSEAVDELKKLATLFDLVVFNTFETRNTAALLNNIAPRKLMWLHECELSYSNLTKEQRANAALALMNVDHITCVGNYAQDKFSQYFPQFKTDKLLYGLPEIPRKELQDHASEEKPVTFGILGTWEMRKNQLGFIDAVSQIPQDLRKKARFVILGNSKFNLDYTSKIKKQASLFSEITLLSELPHHEFIEELNKLDVVVSFSIDDPMPIVLTEAFMNKKAVITTDKTGTASLITPDVNGFVVSSGNSRQLAEIMGKLIGNKNIIKNWGNEGRKIYDEYFSLEFFRKSLDLFLKK